jgi:hypothetical protein
MIKEVGDPIAIAEYLGLDTKGPAGQGHHGQGRQNTNYAITLYACHPSSCRAFPP